MKSRKAIFSRLYIHTSADLPRKLLMAMLENISGLKYKNTSMGYYPKDCEEVETVANQFREILGEVRSIVPSLRMDDWYLLSLSCLGAGRNLVIPILSDNEFRSFHEYKVKHGHGSNFAERVWSQFKQVGGLIR